MTKIKKVLHVVEPSKVRYQHIFVIDGYLRAIRMALSGAPEWTLRFWGSASTIAALSPEAVQDCERRRIPVMDPERRRVVRKCLLEAIVSAWCLLRMKRRDILIITCLHSPALLLFQVFAAVIPRRNVFIVLHGELETLAETSLHSSSIRSVGFWARRWLKLRNSNSPVKLIVLDDFIRERMLKEYPGVVQDNAIWTVRPPVVSHRCLRSGLIEAQGDRLRVCFVGYRTRFKSFENFLLCAKEHPDWQFLAIGGGSAVDVRTGEARQLCSNQEYLDAISACDLALFPYDSGYSMSLSASGLDALATGVYIVALDRPFFVSLRNALGREVVTVCQDIAEINQFLRALNVSEIRRGKARRSELVAASMFSTNSVAGVFKSLVQVEGADSVVSGEQGGA